MTVLVKVAILVVVGGIIILAVTYLAEFFIPLIVGLVLLFVAYLILQYLLGGHTITLTI